MNDMTPISAIHDTGASQNAISKISIRPEWYNCIKRVQSPVLTAASKQISEVEGVVLLHVLKGNLCFLICFGIVARLVVALFVETPFLYRFVKDIFMIPLTKRYKEGSSDDFSSTILLSLWNLPGECKIVPENSHPVAILSTFRTVSNVIEGAARTADNTDHYVLFRVSPVAAIPESSKATVLVHSKGSGLLNVVCHERVANKHMVIAA